MDKRRLTKYVRDKNIAVSVDRPKPEEPAQVVDLGLTKEEIKAKLKPKREPKKKVERPFLVLKDQECYMAERDYEITEELKKSYIEQSKSRKTITDKGDRGQKNLYFTDVRSCPRQVYYKFFEPERARDYTVKGLILFDDGDRHHLNIQRRLEDRGKGINPEGFLEVPEVGATGYYDQLYVVGNENGYTLCDIEEIKSKFPFACTDIDQEDYDQAQLYIYAAQFSKRLQTKHIKVIGARLVYKDRAVQTEEVHFAWRLKPDPERQQQILEYFRYLKFTVIDQKKLVPHPYEKKSTKCEYCRFKEWCWRKFPDKVDEWQPTEDLENVKLPAQEILESFAKRLYEILKQEKELREEKKKLEPIMLKYFLETKNAILPVNQFEGLAPKQGSRSEWDIQGLRAALGDEFYAKISKPDSSLIKDLIFKEYVDASKFETFKTIKQSKPSLYIKKLQGGLDNAD